MGWTAWGRMAAMGGLAAACGLALNACGHNTPSSGASIHATGDVLDNGKPVGSSASIARGDLIAVQSGSAKISMPGGAKLELRSGSAMRWSDPPTIVGGDVLAVSSSDKSPVTLSTTVADVTVAGASRIRRDLALTVGTYAGQAVVRAGRTVTIPALTQDTIPSVSVAPVPSPLQLDANDVWDQRFLGAAIELTNQLDSQSRYMDANVPTSLADSASFYEHELNGRAVPATLLAATNPTAGDGVAAAAIALSGPGDFAARWRYAFALRSAGAQWGIVVLAEGANPAQVLQLVEAAVRDAATAVTPAVSTTPLLALPLTPAPVVAPAAQAAPPTQQASTRITKKPVASRPTTTVPRPTTTTTPPQGLGALLNPVLTPLEHLLGDLLGTNKH